MPYNRSNYSFVIDSSFKPFEMQELLTPLTMYKDVYEKQESAINELEEKASVWDGMANEQTDPIAYAQYKRYADDLKQKADTLASVGLSPQTRRSIMDMKRRYASEIVPIEQAYAARKAQADEQRKALLQNPTLLLSRRADMTSLDRYLENPQLGYDSYSGALLSSQVGTAASALAKELRESIKTGKLDNYTKTWIEAHGFTSGEVAQAIEHPEDPRSSRVLNTLVENVITDSGITNWADTATRKQAYNYARQGLWNAVGQSDVHTYEDYGARLGAQEASSRRLQQPQTLPGGGLAINPINIFSNKERTEQSNNIENFSQYFKQNKNGEWELTDEGIAKWKEPRTAPNFRGKANEFNFGFESSQNIINPLQDFLQKLGLKKMVGSTERVKKYVGKLWENYLNQNKQAVYDATKSTEFDYTLDDTQQKGLKAALQTAARGTKLNEVDFDVKANAFKPTGESLDLSDLNKDDYTVLSTRFSPYGNSVMIRDKDGEVRRYNMPQGINPTNESNRDKMMQAAQMWQNVITTGTYQDAKGNVHQATPDEITYAQMQYGQALQMAYLYHSQLGVQNKTKEQEFNPYGY